MSLTRWATGVMDASSSRLCEVRSGQERYMLKKHNNRLTTDRKKSNNDMALAGWVEAVGIVES